MFAGDGVEHNLCCLRGGGDNYLACRSLDEVGSCLDGQFRGPRDKSRGGEFASLEDDLEGSFLTAFADGGYFVAHPLFVAFYEGTATDDHIYLVGTFIESILYLSQFNMQW